MTMGACMIRVLRHHIRAGCAPRSRKAPVNDSEHGVIVTQRALLRTVEPPLTFRRDRPVARAAAEALPLRRSRFGRSRAATARSVCWSVRRTEVVSLFVELEVAVPDTSLGAQVRSRSARTGRAHPRACVARAPIDLGLPPSWRSTAATADMPRAIDKLEPSRERGCNVSVDVVTGLFDRPRSATQNQSDIRVIAFGFPGRGMTRSCASGSLIAS